jgi:hypothetical protein
MTHVGSRLALGRSAEASALGIPRDRNEGALGRPSRRRAVIAMTAGGSMLVAPTITQSERGRSRF